MRSHVQVRWGNIELSASSILANRLTKIMKSEDKISDRAGDEFFTIRTAKSSDTGIREIGSTACRLVLGDEGRRFSGASRVVSPEVRRYSPGLARAEGADWDCITGLKG
ncbi:MAG: hypothetical protein K0Q73_1887 [Paenibacillus sp.]|jgi:hypothetical protein|nr:hypothetical protein [Paenibacillus sp.]